MRTKIMRWMWADTMPYWFYDWRIAHTIARVLCALYGHDPEMDNCMRPEHDLCHYCMKRMPGKAKQRHG